jgi:excisionase family DNA binding protein
MMEELVTIDEISKYLGVKKSTLYWKVETRQIPHYKIGNLLRFRKSEIEAWLQSTKSEPRKPQPERIATPRGSHASRSEIDEIVSRAVASSKGIKYTPKYKGDRTRIRGLGKEVSDGTV